jgi:ornithine carbamoyltransferase
VSSIPREHLAVRELPTPLPVDLRGRSLSRITDLAPAELEAVLDLAAELKRRHAAREPSGRSRTHARPPLPQSSTYPVSLEVAMAGLGGTTVQLPPTELQLARGESLEDTARVLSRYLDVLAVRTGPHAEIEQLAAMSSIPVVNALSDAEHPLQALADLLTVRERLGALDGVRIAWVGDGTNVCVSLAAACELVGAEFTCASPRATSPPGRGPPRSARAVEGAHVVVTDVGEHGAGGTEERRAHDLRPTRSTRRSSGTRIRRDRALPAHPGEISPAAWLRSAGRGGEPPAHGEGAPRSSSAGRLGYMPVGLRPSRVLSARSRR